MVNFPHGDLLVDLIACNFAGQEFHMRFHATRVLLKESCTYQD